MPHAATFTYDLDSSDATLLNISYVRNRIRDIDPNFPLFVDAEIKAFLVMENFIIKSTAALALETIAADEAMVLKVIKILQLSTDGAKVAAELRANARLLREQADTEASVDGATFDIAEWVVDDFSLRDRLINQGLRGAL